jgi:bud site selection protein 31
VSSGVSCCDDAGSGGGPPSLALARFGGPGAMESCVTNFCLAEHQLLPQTPPYSTLPLHKTACYHWGDYEATRPYERYTEPSSAMPPIRTARASKKAPPEGFEDIEDTLLEFQNKMKDAENASHEGKKKYEMTWPIFQITHQRSRYIYDLYYEKEAISKPLYDYLLKNGYADAMLIAKWKKQGYEKVSASTEHVLPDSTNSRQLCCTRCIQTKETNFRSTCICRVPRAQLKENQDIQCVNCGCRGCGSSD